MTIEEANKYIDDIAKESLNNEQRKLAKFIIEKTSSNGIVDDKVISFITPNIKLGFVFDKAPEVSQDNISLLIENKSLQINNQSIERERERALFVHWWKLWSFKKFKINSYKI